MSIDVWQYQLRRNFICAGRMCWVELAALRSETGEARFTVRWMPEKPLRLTLADIEHFQTERRKAEIELLADLEALRC